MTKYVYATNSFNLIADEARQGEDGRSAGSAPAQAGAEEMGAHRAATKQLDGLNNDAVIRTYTWGKDLSGTLSGAGGVGGLLMLSEAGTDYLATYDGNGNLVALTNATDGSLAAAYEYSPYGRLLRAEGPMAQKNPFRFSTKYTDDETGLVYYGFRYYDPSLGRFINRDPIEEQGGLNLYQAFNNDPINKIDVLGMYTQGGSCRLVEYWIYWGTGLGERTYVLECDDDVDLGKINTTDKWLPVTDLFDGHVPGEDGFQLNPNYIAQGPLTFDEGLAALEDQYALDNFGVGRPGGDSDPAPAASTPEPELFTPVSSRNEISDFSQGGPKSSPYKGHPDAIAKWTSLNPIQVTDIEEIDNTKLKNTLDTLVSSNDFLALSKRLEFFRTARYKKRKGKWEIDPSGKYVREAGATFAVNRDKYERYQLANGEFMSFSNYEKASGLTQGGRMTTELSASRNWGKDVVNINAHTHPWGTVPSTTDLSSKIGWNFVYSSKGTKPTVYVFNPGATEGWEIPTELLLPKP